MPLWSRQNCFVVFFYCSNTQLGVPLYTKNAFYIYKGTQYSHIRAHIKLDTYPVHPSLGLIIPKYDPSLDSYGRTPDGRLKSWKDDKFWNLYILEWSSRCTWLGFFKLLSTLHPNARQFHSQIFDCAALSKISKTNVNTQANNLWVSCHETKNNNTNGKQFVCKLPYNLVILSG